MFRLQQSSTVLRVRSRFLTRPMASHTATCYKIAKLIESFRSRGHFAASLDPLSVQSNSTLRNGELNESRMGSWLSNDRTSHPDVVRLLRNYPASLDLSIFGLEEYSLDEPLYLGDEMSHFPCDKKSSQYWSIRELVTVLKNTYCGTYGMEYTHLADDEQRLWLQRKIEGGFSGDRDTDYMKRTLRLLMGTNNTSVFLTSRFPGSKVFGIEGSESVLVGLQAVLEAASALGVEAVELGMAHRGRMNILTNVLKRPLRAICCYFSENANPTELGDVKYHLGTRAEILVRGTDGVERTVHISLSANPSHLEAVNPVVIGKTKAKQFFVNDVEKKIVMPILLHGDASFSGQGIVPEVLELSNLPDYSVGGCVHIVINNQIGFTTDARQARTSYHCTNVAKGIGAPIFHVNGDDVDAVVSVCHLAAEFRQKFKRDVVVDILCYRKFGHNSLDDPSITSPITQKLIDAQRTTLDIYVEKLLSLGVVTKKEVSEMSDNIFKQYDEELRESRSYIPDPLEWLSSNWQGAAIGNMLARRPYNQTGVRPSVLKAVGDALLRVPKDFVIHKDVERILAAREKMIRTGEGITWGFAEALAFGCLLRKFSPKSKDGLRGLEAHERTVAKAASLVAGPLDVPMQSHPTVHVRLSGQDCVRGTFNQRHAAIYCNRTGRSYVQLNHLGKDEEQATLSVCNSSLSEAAVLAFEYGYSLSNELALVLWEAQFGDFANVAQSIIDNFIASGESKWMNQSSLVLLLPHGHDGQGPEHTSARLERFLQLVDDDCDDIPGASTYTTAEMDAGFDALDKGKEGFISWDELKKQVLRYSPELTSERVDLTLAEILLELGVAGVSETGGKLSKSVWRKLMASWLQSNSERRHNLIVVVPSTPAQYFHVLRRQVHRPYAKPLVCLSAKWLLHHKSCTSRMDDMTTGTFFQRIIVEGGRGDNLYAQIREPLVSAENMRRVIFCSGKIYYHLFHARNAAGINDITLIRIEQIAPFPYDLLEPVLALYRNAEIAFVQEEHKNQGAWTYVKPRFETLFRNMNSDRRIVYVGRAPSPASATGAYRVHAQEQKEIIDKALSPRVLTNSHYHRGWFA